MSDKKKAIKLSTLEAIGSALRNKEGTTDLIPVNTLADRIAALPSGVNKLPQIVANTVTELTAEDFAGITRIGSYGLAFRTNLVSVTIPNNITGIGTYAFQDCRKLKNVTISEGIIALSQGMFQFCEALEHITIPNSVKNLSTNVFYSCRKLKSIIIPDNVVAIPQSAFHYCENLTNVTIGSGVKSIELSAFTSCVSLISIVIPSNVERLASNSLHMGSSTNKATITFLGTTPPSIQTSTFNAYMLEKIIVPAGCGEVYKSATNWAKFADYIEDATE